MDLSRIDLNLLLVLHRLLQERHVSRSAAALGLTQPAVSNALRRLRSLLGDDLLVRTAGGMRPTPYAERLAGPLAQALGALEGALSTREQFDPAASERRFTLALSDVGEIYFLPVLMPALATEAPGVTLRVVPLALPDLAEAMAAGEVDLALGSLPGLQSGFYQQALLRQRYVCLMRDGHPGAARRLTRAAFTGFDHVRVEALGTGHGRVDEALARAGLARRIRLSVPNFVALGHVLRSTDLMATVPERLAERVGAPLGLLTRPLPVRLPSPEIHQLWHATRHRDSGHQWLRAFIARLFADAPAARVRVNGR
ncbi:MAG: LysR family transcriptional regulator [Burkholderiaceae bacterium]